MKAHELLRLLSSTELDALVRDACQDEEIPDKIAGGVITYQKIPLARFARLPDETRRAYVRRTLRDKQAADLTLFVLSAALVKGHADLISAFLEAAGLEHEGPSLSFEGEIPEPKPRTLKAAIDTVLKNFPARQVSLYLHAFAGQADVHWKTLDERLATDPKLKLEDRST